MSEEAKDLWRQYLAGWSIDHAGRVLLLAALESFDLTRSAQAEIAHEGLIVSGRPHPATTVLRDARIAQLRALRQLGLDIIQPEPRVGRPADRR